MRISQLSLAGHGAWADLELPHLGDELNVFFAEPHGGKSTLARLVGQLLYGKADGNRRLQIGQPLLPAEGAVTVESAAGSLVLRRRREANGSSRLTVSSPTGTVVDAQMVRDLLGDLSPRLAAQLFAVDFAESPRVDALVSDPFAREFTSQLRAEAPHAFTGEQLDRRRIDELIQQKNSVARQIEQHVQVGRRESAILDKESTELDRKLAELRDQAAQIESELRRLDARRTELSAELRCQSLESQAAVAVQFDSEAHNRQLRELEIEIARCRQALGDLQTRSVALRTELAQLSPDGTADRVTSLSDGRTTLVVVERLLDDLDAEVSQLARAPQPGRGVTSDTHSRLTPLTRLLRQQLYALCGHWSEQERSVRRGQLSAESRQVERAQSDLGERLEHLLARRETLIAEEQAVTQPALHLPQAPAEDFCRCEHHGEYAQSAKGLRKVELIRRELSQVERERAALGIEQTAVWQAIAATEAEWKRLQQERAGLVGGAVIEAKRAELDRLESILQQALGVRIHDPNQPGGKLWRASDVLAQLTGGRLVQIRLFREEGRATILDNAGRSLALANLTPAEHDQLYVALTLALTSASAARGVHLPLLLDEPFLRLNPHDAAVMAGVLEEFGRAGHQILVFTEDREARRVFELLNVRLIDMDEARGTPSASHPDAPQPVVQKAGARLVRETLDGRQTAGLRLASGHGAGDIEAVFYLSAASSLNEFPVLGSGTGAIFAQLGIHAVGDLLAADPAEIARRLDRPDIRVETVKLWQSHMSLLCHVPELSLNDAQVLTACGIASPRELREADSARLWEAVETFLASNAALRFGAVQQRYTRERIADWVYAAGGVRQAKSRKKRPRRKVSSGGERGRKRQ